MVPLMLAAGVGFGSQLLALQRLRSGLSRSPEAAAAAGGGGVRLPLAGWAWAGLALGRRVEGARAGARRAIEKGGKRVGPARLHSNQPVRKPAFRPPSHPNRASKEVIRLISRTTQSILY